MRTIQYAVDVDTGLVVPRVGDKVAWPVLEYESMTSANGFATSYKLEEFGLFDVLYHLRYLRWTRKVPDELKNVHRRFWGMRPVAVKEAPTPARRLRR